MEYGYPLSIKVTLIIMRTLLIVVLLLLLAFVTFIWYVAVNPDKEELIKDREQRKTIGVA